MMASEMYMMITGDANLEFTKNFLGDPSGDVALLDVCDMILEGIDSQELPLYGKNDHGSRVITGNMFINEPDLITINLDGELVPCHVHPRKIILLMIDRIRDAPYNSRHARVTNMDEDLEIHPVEKEQLNNQCSNCGVKIPSAPRCNLFLGRHLCDTCYNKFSGCS
jgi:hypothetical protein